MTVFNGPFWHIFLIPVSFYLQAYNADAASIPDPIIEELVDEQLRDFQVLIKKEIVGHDIVSFTTGIVK